MKKIVILTAGYGGGHNAAARSLAQGLILEGVEERNIKVVDLLQGKYGKMNEVVQKAYIAAVHRAPMVWGKIYNAIDSYKMIEGRIAAFPPLKKAMKALLEEEKPAVVVSTFPVYNSLIASIYRNDREPRGFRQFTVVTDSITVNAIWYRCKCDLFFVPNEATAGVLIKGGVSEAGVRALGFPVDPYFAQAAEVQKEPPEVGGRWRVLYALQQWQSEALETVRALARLRGVELTVTVAGEGDLEAKVKRAMAMEGAEGEVFGRTPRMPELMARSHLLIGKAGGAMVHEALAARTPMLITQVIPGQEEGNARLITEQGCGAVTKEREEIVATVETLFAEGGRKWLDWHERLLPLSYPNAAREVARAVLQFP